MKKTTKRFLAIMMAAIMALPMLPMIALADNTVDKSKLATPSFNAPVYHRTATVPDTYYGNIVYTYADGTNNDLDNRTKFTDETQQDHLKMKFATPSVVVGVYDGVTRPSFPIVMETKWSTHSGGGEYICFVQPNANSAATWNARKINFRYDWYGDSGNTDWTAWPSGSGYSFKAEANAQISRSSGGGNGSNNDEQSDQLGKGGTKSADQNNTSDSRFWRNSIEYYGNFSDGSYSDTITNATLLVGHVSKADNWIFDQKWYYYSQEKAISNTFYVINYKPIYDILADARDKAEEINTNGYKYTEASLTQAVTALNAVANCNPKNYDFSSDTANKVSQCATAIKNAKEAYDEINLVEKKVITYVKADNTSTVARFEEGASAADVAAAAPSLPANNFANGKHYTYSWDKAFASVTGDTTYTQEASEVAHVYGLYTHIDSTSTHSATCTVNGQSHSDIFDCDFETESFDVSGDTNSFTRYTCKYCGYTYDGDYGAQDWTAYDAAVETYNINKDDTFYTEASRAAYVEAVNPMLLDTTDKTISTKRINDVAAAINAAADTYLVEDKPNDTYNLTIEDDIEVNFNIDTVYQNDNAGQNGSVEVEYIAMNEEEISTDTTSETFAFSSTDTQKTITMQAVPAQIAEPYKFTVKDSEGKTVREFEQSVEDYCIAIINSTDTAVTAKDKEVAKSLLAYGAAASNYFNYATTTTTPGYEVDENDLAGHADYVTVFNAENDIKNNAAHTPVASSISSGNDASGKPIRITNISYVALNDPEFRFYVNQTNQVYAAMTDVSIAFEDPTVTDVEAKMVHTPNGNCVRVTGLKASEFDKVFTLTIGGTAIKFNGYAYLYSILKTGSSVTDANLKDLAMSVFRYAAACQDKFNA